MRWVSLARLLAVVYYGTVAVSCARPAGEGQVAQPLVADAGPPDLAWVDFVVSDCKTATATGCRGPVPLTMHFGALAPRTIESYRWTFGDGAPDSTEETPAHPYAKPGHYSVTLVASAAGKTIQTTKVDFVIADPLSYGLACHAGQCAAGLTCICGDDPGCPGVPGLCGVACSPLCNSGTVCIGFSAGSFDWQRSLCLPSCTGNVDCLTGNTCRELPARNGWAQACWAGGFPFDDGQSCLGTDGAPDDASCAGGSCLPLGARGLCASSCDATHACPSYATCANLSNGERRCLVGCSTARPCTGDPFLTCQASDATGDLGFTVPSVAGGAGSYCAPRRCMRKSDCGPDGDCVASGSASFCTRAN